MLAGEGIFATRYLNEPAFSFEFVSDKWRFAAPIVPLFAFFV